MTQLVIGILISALAIAGYSVALARLVRSDGRSVFGLPASNDLPRSHRTDAFEPRPWW